MNRHMSTQQQDNIFDKIQKNLVAPIFDIIGEIQRLFPDSVLFGSLFLYILTHNKALGVLAVFMLEIIGSHKLLSNIFEKVYGPNASSSRPSSCYPGFRVPRMEADRILMSNKYPSLSLLSMSALASYLFSSVLSFQETLQTMGPDWEGRVGFSMAFIILMMLSSIAARFFIGCETTSEILVAALCGILLGVVFYAINHALFGAEGLNFLGLPYLVDKSKKGSDIYVCAPQNQKHL